MNTALILFRIAEFVKNFNFGQGYGGKTDVFSHGESRDCAAPSGLEHGWRLYPGRHSLRSFCPGLSSAALSGLKNIALGRLRGAVPKVV